ncbi:MAG: rubrerythrin family protein [Nanoarchaeota archaeon]|nr:rubrerythrin family protein [Nanoarchaeota archaeon]
MTSQENLMKAFAGESQANRRYLAFAKKADEDGFKQVAKLFRAAADAETVHALRHFKVAGGIKDTKENLKEAVAGETYEMNEMYPEMIKLAEEENNSEALLSFKGAHAAEKIHAELYKEALESVESGSDLPEKELYVCQVCGHTVHEVPDTCPICGVPKEQFKKIE